ncbi:MAG TPA: PQQ-dependent sugar dehydrogenase, partial [Actinomycetota bacterium]|nr:PQQ-dependent sugar dehydrogenase [Actinomycetota bacterium]
TAVLPDGTVREVRADFGDLFAEGETGLMGLALDPAFDDNRRLYSCQGKRSGSIAVIAWTVADDWSSATRVADPLVGDIPLNEGSGRHGGCRLRFVPDGALLIGTGDNARGTNPQDPESLAGKVLRADAVTGEVEVWTLGHRNVQGLAWDDQGRMFATEFGQNRVDEINRIEAGGNYGWPEVEGTGGGDRFRDPLVTWPTSQASPSGAAIGGDTMYVATLRGERLWRVPLDGAGGTGAPAAVLAGSYGRLRHAAVAPDRALWVLTSNRDGRGDPAADDDRVLRFPRA